MKKILIILISSFLLLTGCKKEVSIEELEKVNEQITNYFVSGGEYTNLSAHYVDEELKKVVVELAENTKDEQEKFKTLVLNSKLIEFIQGGPYTTSGIDRSHLESTIGGLIASQSGYDIIKIEELINIDTSKIKYSKVMKNGIEGIALLIVTKDKDIINEINDYFKTNYKGYKKGKIEDTHVYVYNGYDDFNLDFKDITGTIEKIDEKEILIKEEKEKYIVHYNINIDLKEGDKIKVTYDGNVAYSDPGQLLALYIEKLN